MKPAILTVPIPLLRDALALVVHAAARDGVRPILDSVRFDVIRKRGTPASIKLVACDNYRIAWATIPGTADDDPIAGAVIDRRIDGFTLPIHDATGLLKHLAAMKIARTPVTFTLTGGGASPDAATIDTGQLALTVPLIDGQYPNYGGVIPTGRAKYRFALTGAYLADVAKAFTVAPPRNGQQRPTAATLVFEITGDPLKPVRISTYGSDDHGEALMPVRASER